MSAACTELECDDDSGSGLTSTLLVEAQAGNTYYFTVGSYSASSGTIVFAVTDGTGGGAFSCANTLRAGSINLTADQRIVQSTTASPFITTSCIFGQAEA